MPTRSPRVLWYSNGPQVPSGYGTVTFNVVSRLRKLGHDIWCLPSGEVVWADGKLTPIEEVRVGSIVFSQGSGSRVTKVWKRPFRGRLKVIKPTGLPPMRLTPEHPLLVHPSEGVEAWRYERSWRASNIRRGVGHIQPRPFHGEPMWLPAGRVRVGDYVVVPKPQPSAPRSLDIAAWRLGRANRVARLHLDADAATFLGWYVAEGSASVNGHIALTLGPHEAKEAEWLEGFIEARLGGTPSTLEVPEPRRSLSVRFTNRPLARLLNHDFGHGAVNKRLPWWLITAPKPLLCEFLRAQVQGDGCRIPERGGLGYGTSSRALAYGTMLAMMRFGALPAFYSHPPRTNVIAGRRVRTAGSFSLRVHGPQVREFGGTWHRQNEKPHHFDFEDHLLVRVGEVSSQSYAGIVYNLETIDHTFAAPFALTHNCVDNSHSQQTPARLRGIPVLPGGGGLCEAETYAHYKEGQFDWCLVLYDSFALSAIAKYLGEDRNFRVVAHVPFDHDQIYPNVRAFLEASTLILPYAQYGYDLVAKESNLKRKLRGPIPHGVDAKVFKPLDEPRGSLVDFLNRMSDPCLTNGAPFQEGDLIVGLVKRNKDLRGWIPEQFEVFRALCDHEPDLPLKLYVHTQARTQEGHDLPHIASLLGIADRVRFVKQYREVMGIPPEEMARLYNACDLGMMCTSSEGFGLPTLEWASCGKPVIGSDNTTTRELLAWAPELRVKQAGTYWMFNSCRYYHFDKADAVRAARVAINHDPSDWRKRGAAFAAAYDYDRLVRERWDPFMRHLEEYVEEQCLRLPAQDQRWDAVKQPWQVALP